ncbi:MAG TPA: TolC family protein, partial [Aliarcobacter cryaerophilus]|nr:TolC family protein [Aliarcobacter cryaerophilus]
QRELLEKLKLKNENVLKLKMEVLEMFLEKYKVSQTTLMELLNIKNQVIQTKENLIKINIALNQNAININYIQGDINAQNLIN